MSGLGAFDASDLGAFQQSALKARGPALTELVGVRWVSIAPYATGACQPYPVNPYTSAALYVMGDLVGDIVAGTYIIFGGVTISPLSASLIGAVTKISGAENSWDGFAEPTEISIHRADGSLIGSYSFPESTYSSQTLCLLTTDIQLWTREYGTIL